MQLKVSTEVWPVAGTFKISRFEATESHIVLVELTKDGHIGRGECEPHESDHGMTAKVVSQIEGVRQQIEAGAGRETLSSLLPNPRARNAVDCAMWDIEAKSRGMSVWQLAGLREAGPIVTAYTIGLDTPEVMAEKAAVQKRRKLLKIKLGRKEGDIDRLTAVRAAAPDVRLIVDANEGWTFEHLVDYAPRLAALGVELIEQPLPASADRMLENYRSPVPVCADEACLDRSSLPNVVGRYDFVNIKLDKTGGLTEALLLAQEAQRLGLRLMTGCMLGTSLAMAPAFVVASLCEFVDLDAPLLLAADRQPAMRYDNENSLVFPPSAALWG